MLNANSASRQGAWTKQQREMNTYQIDEAEGGGGGMAESCRETETKKANSN